MLPSCLHATGCHQQLPYSNAHIKAVFRIQRHSTSATRLRSGPLLTRALCGPLSRSTSSSLPKCAAMMKRVQCSPSSFVHMDSRWWIVVACKTRPCWRWVALCARSIHESLSMTGRDDEALHACVMARVILDCGCWVGSVSVIEPLDQPRRVL